MPNEVFIYYPEEENNGIQHFQMIQPEDNEIQPLNPEPINPETNPNIQYHNSTSNNYDVGFTFFNIIFHIFFLFMIIEFIKQCYLNIRNRRNNIIIRENLTNNNYNYHYNKIIVKENFNNEICSICLEELINYDDVENNDEVISLVCNHMFHKKCVDPWIINNKNCPLCKRNV